MLGQRIQLPDGIESARWSVVPLGTVGGAAPGPTDTRLYAFLEPHRAAAANLKTLTPAERQQTSATVPPDIARDVLPPEATATLRSEPSGELLLPGERYDPSAFDRGSYHGVYAVEVGEGLLVCLQTR
ncbi:MAG TPA: hypothetical protein VGJ60_15830 [Chloroflexota bacterium]